MAVEKAGKGRGLRAAATRANDAPCRALLETPFSGEGSDSEWGRSPKADRVVLTLRTSAELRETGAEEWGGNGVCAAGAHTCSSAVCEGGREVRAKERNPTTPMMTCVSEDWQRTVESGERGAERWRQRERDREGEREGHREKGDAA